MSTEEQMKGKGQAARNAAVKKLIEAHAEEFAAIHGEERKARGLFAVAKQKTRAELEAETAKLAAEVEAMRAKLSAAGIL